MLAPTAQAQILVVDDDPRNLLAVEAVLDDMALELVTASSGADTLRLLLTREFALIILDVHMPGMDGFETAHLIRGSERTRHIPIIFLTANADLQRVATGYAHGAVDYMVKPFVPEVLRAKVQVFVDLYRKNRLLVEIERTSHEQRLAEERSRWEADLLRANLERERAAGEALAVANQKLEVALAQARQALATRDQFLRMASHELKTPLTALQLTVGNALARDDVHGAGAEKIRRALTVVDRQLTRLSVLGEELLSVVVIEGGRLRINARDGDLGDIARRVVEDLEPLTSLARCPVNLHVASPVRGRWDAFWLQQALANLVTNAAKFGAGAPIDVVVERQGQLATVRVRDQGIGIAAADHVRIFEPFERAVSPDHYGGLGLGLHIVKRIVEDHGGRVRVDSAEGAGAQFLIELPAG